jgi:hypothetical protein
VSAPIPTAVGRILVCNNTPGPGELVRTHRQMRLFPEQRWVIRSDQWTCCRLDDGRTSWEWLRWFDEKKTAWINHHDPRYPRPEWRAHRWVPVLARLRAKEERNEFIHTTDLNGLPPALRARLRHWVSEEA